MSLRHLIVPEVKEATAGCAKHTTNLKEILLAIDI